MKKSIYLLLGLLLALKGTYAQVEVSILTNKGEIVVSLYEETPIHRDNFLKLVEKEFYDSILFHRVIKDFMIQAGDPGAKPSSKKKKFGGGGPGYTLEAEIMPQFIHKKGALAAARLGDDINPKRRSSGSQFYIVQGRTFQRKYMSTFEETRGAKYSEKELEIYETYGGTPHLDGQYTVFGEVVQGMNIVEEIARVKTNTADQPIEAIYIIKMKRIK